MKLGRNGAFHWLSSDSHNLRHLLESAPELFLNRYIVVTSNDSGVPSLSPQRQALGWRFDSGVLYSPCLNTTDLLASIPCQIEGPDGPAFDEWYLFDSPPPDLQPLEVFVNYYFTLDRNTPHPKETEFWNQLSRLQPLCYFADGAEDVMVLSESEALITAFSRHLPKDA